MNMKTNNSILESILVKLETLNIDFLDYKEINYGYQFKLGVSGYLRVYYNKKLRIKYDTSQIKDKSIISKFNELNNVKDDSNFAISNIVKLKISYPNIGTDESGKGDYFGPLVVAGVMLDKKQESQLLEIGVKDSKKISDSRIKVLANKIKRIVDAYDIVIIRNLRYNSLYSEIPNVNRILAWGHARIIENLLIKKSVNFVYSDQFGDKKLIENALMKKSSSVNLTQLHRAEVITSVAAASILARDAFVKELESMSRKFNRDIPKGASNISNKIAVELVSNYGEDILLQTTKYHFKNTSKVLSKQRVD